MRHPVHNINNLLFEYSFWSFIYTKFIFDNYTSYHLKFKVSNWLLILRILYWQSFIDILCLFIPHFIVIRIHLAVDLIISYQGHHGEFEPGKVQYSTQKFFDWLFLMRAYWNPKSRQVPNLACHGGPAYYKSFYIWIFLSLSFNSKKVIDY